jgi:hypothetical protein
MKKSFKYTLQAKSGKILLQSIVTFGSENKPFPKDWKEDGFAQLMIESYKEEFIRQNFNLLVSENLDFDI